MIAIIEIGSKQYVVKLDEQILVEKIPGKAGENFKIYKVLLTYDKELNLGKPYLKNTIVEAEIVEQFRSKKIKVFRYKPKKRYRKMKGHRQYLTKIKITKLESKNPTT